MDFSSHNPRSCNALSLAARRNDISNLRRLLKKINPNCVDNRGWTCLHEAAFHDSLECLEIILKRQTCRPYVESHEGHTALYVACLNTFSTRCIKYLLENVDDIANYGSKEGFTPLHIVSRQGRTDVLQLLIDHGAIIDVVDFDGDTPLHEACMAKQPEIVNLLLHAGAQPEIPNDGKATPLHIACFRGCLDTVKYLLPFVTDINALDYNGYSPLMTACRGENEDLVLFVLEHGGDPNIENARGKMAIDIALERGLVRCFKMLFRVTDKNKISSHLVYLALSPGYLNIDIVDTILASDCMDPEFFMYSRPWVHNSAQIEESQYSIVQTKEPYATFAPLTMLLNVAEYVYKLSVDKFDEWFCLILMKGLSVNAMHKDEMPPLVWLQYCPHSECFEHVLDLLVQFGYDVDYCSEMINCFDKIPGLTTCYGSFLQLGSDKVNRLPDAFFAALLADPETLPSMITYSLHCDPGCILRMAFHFGECLPTSVISALTKMIDCNSKINDYDSFKHFVPPLKHLSRLQVRQLIKQHRITTTKQYLDLLDKLPLPKQMQQYLRFL